MKGRLVLEDGTVFHGEAFGATGMSSGEVVFTTNMTGYQEVLTDPSYCGQIVTMTYPLIGNYGCNHSFSQSLSPWVKGFLVREACTHPSHSQSVQSIDEYLYENGIIGLSGIDTRALTRHLREAGVMKGVITTSEEAACDLAGVAHGADMGGLVKAVTTRRPYRIMGDGARVVVLDFGIKTGILKELTALDADVAVLPASTPLEVIEDMDPDGIFLSNGPGDPQDVGPVIQTVRSLLQNYPVFGICLGHQIIGLAMGGSTYKLKYGHRGGNHPVKDLTTGRTYITSQNHGYAIDEQSLAGTGLHVTHLNQNDGTVEGMAHESLPVFSVQYHPEGFPGPEDSRHLFLQFMEMMGRGVNAKTA
jgi:carbamoyl-phosphate synthase small subunit